MQPCKCNFRLSTVTYYGHELSAEGIRVSEAKLQAITKMKRPGNKDEVRRFLGMIAYVAKFLEGLSEVSAPIRALLQDDMIWDWTSVQDAAFQKLKDMVTAAPVLAHYSHQAPIIVSADASSFGLGAVLLQEQPDGRRAPVTYISRALTASEQKYAQIEKEALAMTWACERLHCYLFGCEEPFLIETDHRPLVPIMTYQSLDECPPRLMRMKLRLQRYCFRVEYVPGKKLTVADTLSRAPVEPGDSLIATLVDEHVAVVSDLLQGSDEQLQRVREESLRDPQLSALLAILKTEWPKARQELSWELRGYWDSRQLLTHIDGLILRGVQMIIPRSMRAEMCKRAHEGHLGIAKTLSRVREVIWWPVMSNEIRQKMENCEICAHHRHQQRKEPLQPTVLPSRPWEKLASDLFVWQGVHYIVAVDYYSRFPEVRRLSGLSASSVIQALKSIFACHGIPCELVSDNGPQYSCAEFRRFASEYGFKHLTSSPRYPQGNGLVERCVQTVKNLLKKAHESGGDFYLALMAYRAAPKQTKGVSPAQLLMGRSLRTTLSSLPPLLQPKLVERDLISERDAHMKGKQVEYYNARQGALPLTPLNVGDKVLVWDMDVRLWRIPAVVIKVVNNPSYIVRRQGGSTMRRNRHQLQLRPNPRFGAIFDEDEEEKGTRGEDTEEQDTVEGEQEEIRDEAVGAGDRQQVVVRTRSGREVRRPGWQNDYVT